MFRELYLNKKKKKNANAERIARINFLACMRYICKDLFVVCFYKVKFI